MDIEIKHCNNIDSASITLIEKQLNIKFAPNGTGKSTIARAIQCAVKHDDSGMASLLPFKYRESNENNIQPEVYV